MAVNFTMLINIPCYGDLSLVNKSNSAMTVDDVKQFKMFSEKRELVSSSCVDKHAFQELRFLTDLKYQFMCSFKFPFGI